MEDFPIVNLEYPILFFSRSRNDFGSEASTTLTAKLAACQLLLEAQPRPSSALTL